MSAALKSPKAIDNMHRQVMAIGWKLLQPFQFADNDAEHIRLLLGQARFPAGARILDVGCGVGECARLMKDQRPDLEFVLVNFSEAQLADCPEGFEKHLADAHDLPFSDESFDAVMFNAALGNMDAMVALAEASRVLKPGGVLFLNELARVEGDNADLERLLAFRAYPGEALCAFAGDMGFIEMSAKSPKVVFEALCAHMSEADYRAAFNGVVPMLWRFVKGDVTPIAARRGAIFHRHERIALQVSGGKDSLAVLYGMQPWWDRLCVYWLNPGDPFPETVELMARIRSEVPYFVEVAGRQREIIELDGWPSDVVPQAYTTDGNFVFGPTPFKVQTRLSCCFRALMLPMHERMVADGVTCVIRGKRAEEKDKTESRTGSVIMGIETVYPLWDMTSDDVLSLLADNGVEVPESYKYATHSLDCMSCTSWWGEGLSRFLHAKHPEHYREYARRIELIKRAVEDQLLDGEV